MQSDVHQRALMENLPHYKEKYEAAKKINVYFVPGFDEERRVKVYYYAIASAMLHEQTMDSLNQGVVPHFAVIVEKGEGVPSRETKDKIKAYYGFDHDAVAVAGNDNPPPANSARAS
jgi:hypothetical protein